ncbi:hypothetical protein ABL78_3085 [Leptomonas seymouri]|uniref:GYF domain-containing protein n=1 Tax=Leptomonas seymouri TaxID=5684 RepID=A0A0N1I8D7_LEPSE|nr:hypothetical protein ABL78_3085 [Leptomonas seymouri]|eukprot:KPI87858.1 hypothetical protein ABL78_3085 [Leptomonas seymouri]
MKRARSSSVDSDATPASAASDSLEPARSPSSSSSSSSSALVEEDEPSAVPLLSILVPVLSLLREDEMFAGALKRLAKERPDQLDQLTELHSMAMAQYELVLMNMTREAILLKALAEARCAGAILPHAWMLRWTARLAVSHGPFTDDAIQKWGREGFFSKKKAELRDINAANAAWVPALAILEGL